MLSCASVATLSLVTGWGAGALTILFFWLRRAPPIRGEEAPAGNPTHAPAGAKIGEA